MIDLILQDLNKRLGEKELSLSCTEAAKDYIAAEGYDPVYGARPLKRYMQKYVETAAAKLILADSVAIGDEIAIDIENDTLVAKRK